MNLSDDSSDILKFIDEIVKTDYETIVETAEQYLSDSKMIKDLTQEFAANATEIMNSIEEVNKAIESTATVSEEGAAGASDIANSVSEVAKAIEDVASISQLQSELAINLNTIVKRFKI